MPKYKPYYSDYVRHMMRFYVRYPDLTRFNTETDRLNHSACKKIIGTYGKINQAILCDIFSSGDTLADSIYQVSLKANINQDKVWALVCDAEKKIAAERGLI